jgi:hypothetical protein
VWDQIQQNKKEHERSQSVIQQPQLWQHATKDYSQDIGEPETGFPVQLVSTFKSTHTLPDGSQKQSTSKHETLVTGLEVLPLDPTLFEIPSGFNRVRRIERTRLASRHDPQGSPDGGDGGASLDQNPILGKSDTDSSHQLAGRKPTCVFTATPMTSYRAPNSRFDTPTNALAGYFPWKYVLYTRLKAS